MLARASRAKDRWRSGSLVLLALALALALPAVLDLELADRFHHLLLAIRRRVALALAALAHALIGFALVADSAARFDLGRFLAKRQLNRPFLLLLLLCVLKRCGDGFPVRTPVGVRELLASSWH